MNVSSSRKPYNNSTGLASRTYDIDPCPLLLLLLLFDLEISFKSDVEHKSKMDIRR